MNSNLEILILEFYQNKKWLYKFPNQVDIEFLNKTGTISDHF